MTPYIALFIGGLVAVLAALGYMLASHEKTGSPILAAMLSAAFGAFTAVTIATEGVMPSGSTTRAICGVYRFGGTCFSRWAWPSSWFCRGRERRA
ncbi:hypothetical protein [Qipengyuania sp. 902]|uniref:hypothetical protein n=1 Tax=Qipengyuania sp. 902 TaxID=3417565 RepID=UPI003EBE5EF1